MTASIQASQAKLLAMIDTDPLTELDNHRRFKERLEQEAARCSHSNEPLSLILLDVDDFNAVNDQRGFAAGDEALKLIAASIRDSAPGFASAARYGGEEFALILPRCDLDTGYLIAESIRRRISSELGTAAFLRITSSCGVAEFGRSTSKAEGLVLAAELALNRAKQLGRDRSCRFDSVPGADANADPYELHRFLQDGSLATIQALAAAVDAKDPYTQGHSQRVAENAARLATFLGSSPAEVELAYRTGTLHDVGKIGVPDTILQKPGRLTDEERAVMETHPVLGEIIARKAPQLEEMLPGVRHHHERWDGNGYPDKLAQTAIPRIARLLAVADTFDAMTSDRPYRKGLATSIAINEIEKGAGTQFDPEMAAAFVQMMREGLEQREAA